jgi:hypothetical protein
MTYNRPPSLEAIPVAESGITPAKARRSSEEPFQRKLELALVIR